MASRFKKVIDSRDWPTIRDTWLNHIPVFSTVDAPPDPGLERLESLQVLAAAGDRGRQADVDGLRTNLVWEAMFLFQKCAHSHLASQRLGTGGMHSWAMFNAYHSAYLGARGIMSILGIALPFMPQGGQMLIDAFPEPDTNKGRKQLQSGAYTFAEFTLASVGRLDQQDVWEALLRTIRVTTLGDIEATLRDELLEIGGGEITGLRNSFIYKAAFWPLADLTADGVEADFGALMSTRLDPEHAGFLLRLSCAVYRLFEQLVADLATLSGPIRNAIDQSRVLQDPSALALTQYNDVFIAGLTV
jgi:hypothetical protein